MYAESAKSLHYVEFIINNIFKNNIFKKIIFRKKSKFETTLYLRFYIITSNLFILDLEFIDN